MENSTPAQALPLINLIRSEYRFMVPHFSTAHIIEETPFYKTHIQYNLRFCETFTPLGLLSCAIRPDACCINHFDKSFLNSHPEINQDSIEIFMQWWSRLVDPKQAAILLFGEKNIQ